MHTILELRNQDFVKYKKDNFILANEAFLAARELFHKVHNKAACGAHATHEGKTILLFDYISAFEDSQERIQKAVRFLKSLQLGTIGARAQDEFFFLN